MYFKCDNTADPAIWIIDLLLVIGEDALAQEILRKNELFLQQTEKVTGVADRARTGSDQVEGGAAIFVIQIK